MKRVILLPLGLLALSGCVRTVGSVVTAPVRAASWGVDKMTTSQSEADRNYGRKMRKEEEKRGRESRKQANRERRERDEGR
jgi:hypothetical protein